MLYPKKLQKQASVGSSVGSMAKSTTNFFKGLMPKSTTNFFKGLMPKSTPGRVMAGAAVGGYLGDKAYKAKQRNKQKLTRSLSRLDRRSPRPVALVQREVSEPYFDYQNKNTYQGNI